MITISRKYHFYAAHRNHELYGESCYSLHGHSFFIEATVLMPVPIDKSGVSILFKELDEQMEPFFKGFDHKLLISEEDPFLPYVQRFNFESRKPMELVIFPFATSAENLSGYFLSRLRGKGLMVTHLDFKETTSGHLTIGGKGRSYKEVVMEEVEKRGCMGWFNTLNRNGKNGWVMLTTYEGGMEILEELEKFTNK